MEKTKGMVMRVVEVMRLLTIDEVPVVIPNNKGRFGLFWHSSVVPLRKERKALLE